MKNNTIVYDIDDKTYINLTNECSNNCTFCLRRNHDGIENYYLWLTKKPTAKEVVSELEKRKVEKAVFCGFGEPLYALDVLLEVAKYLKKIGASVRVNTNGQAKLIAGDGVAKKMKGLVDVVSVSLNASTAEKYQNLCHSIFGEQGFYSLLDFAKELKEEGIKVVFSVVDTIGADEIEACRKVAESVGAEFRVRTYIE